MPAVRRGQGLAVVGGGHASAIGREGAAPGGNADTADRRPHRAGHRAEYRAEYRAGRSVVACSGLSWVAAGGCAGGVSCVASGSVRSLGVPGCRGVRGGCGGWWRVRGWVGGLWWGYPRGRVGCRARCPACAVGGAVSLWRAVRGFVPVLLAGFLFRGLGVRRGCGGPGVRWGWSVGLPWGASGTCGRPPELNSTRGMLWGVGRGAVPGWGVFVLVNSGWSGGGCSGRAGGGAGAAKWIYPHVAGRDG